MPKNVAVSKQDKGKVYCNGWVKRQMNKQIPMQREKGKKYLYIKIDEIQILKKINMKIKINKN